MLSIHRYDESCDLTTGMAERLGQNIRDAVMRDPIAQGVAFRSAVRKCMGCKEQDACKKLQAANGVLTAAPSYCRNNWDNS